MNPHAKGALKENIQRAILELPQKELLQVNFILFKWQTECVEVWENHF